ncbi:MAG: hypothetical protein Tsb002_26750 [Wenzhouxiangellaceae bacterium]
MKQLILILMLCFSSIAAAQQTGAIEGIVTDEAGQPLPGVVITAQAPSLVGERTTVSRADGRFLFRLLPPGDYTLTATMAGMKTAKVSVRLGLGETARPTIVLSPVAIEE